MSYWSKEAWPSFWEPLDLSRDPKVRRGKDGDWDGYDEWLTFRAWRDWQKQRAAQRAASEDVKDSKDRKDKQSWR